VDYQRDRHRVPLIDYHLIFCSKRRRDILIGPIRKRLEQIMDEVIAEHGWHLIE
jgi:REP-associated tyrosine transposase